MVQEYDPEVTLICLQEKSGCGTVLDISYLEETGQRFDGTCAGVSYRCQNCGENAAEFLCSHPEYQ
jgi:hypothetical protein